jgi:hypothetical protein
MAVTMSFSLARAMCRKTGSDGLIVSAVAGSNATDEASKYESNARSFQGELLLLQ